MSPQAGTPVTLVPPAPPAEAVEADNAKTGAIAKFEFETAVAQTSTHAAVKVPPHKPPETQEEKEIKCSWIEIELVDENNQPVPNVRYQIVLPDGTAATHRLNAKGFARVEGFEPGMCKVSFPDLDEDVWEKVD